MAYEKGISLSTLKKEVGFSDEAVVDCGELKLRELHSIAQLLGVDSHELVGQVSAVSIGDKNVTISANGRVNSFFYPIGSRDSDYLARIELLERVISEKQALIDEKERLISILLAREHSSAKEPHML